MKGVSQEIHGRVRSDDHLRIALYSHDTVGLGHLRRNLALATALVQAARPVDVLLVAGSREVAAFAFPRGIDCVVLPALAKRGGEYQARTLYATLEDVVALRASIITAALSTFDPDLLIVDKVARGACNELESALGRLRDEGRARIVLGLRDVLDDPVVTVEEWQTARTTDAVDRFFDEVWIYGDPTVFDAVREYGLPPSVARRVRFTGYIGDRPSVPKAANSGAFPVDGRPYALCLVGGGEDGLALAEAFAEAPLPRDTRGVIVTGPFMDARDRDRLTARAAGRSDLTVVGFVDDCERLIAGAAAVVSMGGYNSVCEILASGTRPLIVPRVRPRAEQLVRAERLAQRDVVDLCHPDDLTPGRLGLWLASGRATQLPSGRPVDLGGLVRIPGLVERLLSSAPAERELVRVDA